MTKEPTKTEQLQGALADAGVAFPEDAGFQALSKIARDNDVTLGDESGNEENNEPTNKEQGQAGGETGTGTDNPDVDGDGNVIDPELGTDNAGDGTEPTVPPVEPETTQEEPEEPKEQNVVDPDKIVADIEGAEDGMNNDFSEEVAPENKDHLPFDVENLSDDQLAILKEKLGSTAVSPKNKQITRTAFLGVYDSKPIVGMGQRSFDRQVFNTEMRKDVIVPMIAVKLMGESEWQDIALKDIINGQKVKVKIKNILHTPTKETIGEVVSVETNQLVPVDVLGQTTVYEVELQGKMFRVSERVLNP